MKKEVGSRFDSEVHDSTELHGKFQNGLQKTGGRKLAGWPFGGGRDQIQFTERSMDQCLCLLSLLYTCNWGASGQINAWNK